MGDQTDLMIHRKDSPMQWMKESILNNRIISLNMMGIVKNYTRKNLKKELYIISMAQPSLSNYKVSSYRQSKVKVLLFKNHNHVNLSHNHKLSHLNQCNKFRIGI